MDFNKQSNSLNSVNICIINNVIFTTLYTESMKAPLKNIIAD